MKVTQSRNKREGGYAGTCPSTNGRRHWRESAREGSHSLKFWAKRQRNALHGVY